MRCFDTLMSTPEASKTCMNTIAFAVVRAFL